ncbi:unnamed protein product [Caenorhabditis sp. 36 PRJEB53466]|nr:unnamed protein product [Caenorhabditis sp. 36 PRJEB53466]
MVSQDQGSGTCRVTNTESILGMDWIKQDQSLYGRLLKGSVNPVAAKQTSSKSPGTVDQAGRHHGSRSNWFGIGEVVKVRDKHGSCIMDRGSTNGRGWFVARTTTRSSSATERQLLSTRLRASTSSPSGASFGYPAIPNLLPQLQAINMVGATTEPRRAIPKQADGTDCPMPPECGCLCGRSGGRKKREVEHFTDADNGSEITCTSGKLRRVVEKALSTAENQGIRFDLGANTLQNYVLFCQSEKFKQLQFSTDSTKYCHVTRGPVNCLVIQH